MSAGERIANMTIRIMIDSQIHDAVLADPDLQALIEKLQSDGAVSVLSTHVQARELSQIPADKDIGQRAAVKAQTVAPSVFVLDPSLLNHDRLGTAETSAAYHAIHGDNPANVEDAMIGATAISDADFLVTNDIRFRKKFEALKSKVKVLSSAELLGLLRTL